MERLVQSWLIGIAHGVLITLAILPANIKPFNIETRILFGVRLQYLYWFTCFCSSYRLKMQGAELEISVTIKEKQEREAVVRFLRQKDRHGNLSTYCETLALIFESGQHRREDVDSLSSEDLLMSSK